MYLRGVCRSVSRIWSACADAASTGARRTSSIWTDRHRSVRAAYLHRVLAGHLRADRVGARCDLAFHPVGFAGPLRSPEAPVRSYRTLSPLTAAGAAAGLLSVARAVVPARRHAFPLGSTVPCGVRTFLPAARRAGIGEATPKPAHYRIKRTGGRPGSPASNAKRQEAPSKKRSGREPSACHFGGLRGPPFPSFRRPFRGIGPGRR